LERLKKIVHCLFNRLCEKWHKQDADRDSHARHCPADLLCPLFAAPACYSDLDAPNTRDV
jgi:hypothetical protein